LESRREKCACGDLKNLSRSKTAILKVGFAKSLTISSKTGLICGFLCDWGGCGSCLY